MARISVEFRVGNLALWRNTVQFNAVSFQKPGNYDELIRAVQQEHKDTDTALANVELQFDPVPDSNRVLEETTRKLQPYLTLLSLAQGSWVRWSTRSAYIEDEEQPVAFEQLSLPFTRPYPSELIRLHDQEAFLRQAYPVISQTTFAERVRFHIALMWYLQAAEQEWEETDFLLLYIGLEALAWAYVEQAYAGDQRRLSNFGTRPKSKINEFLTRMNAPLNIFFPDPKEDLHGLRNHIAHRGMSFQRSKPGPFGKQILQLRGLLDWLFLTLVQYRGPYRDVSRKGEDRVFP